MRSIAPHEQNVAVRLPSWDEVWKGAAVALILFLFFVGGVTSRQVFVEGDESWGNATEGSPSGHAGVNGSPPQVPKENSPYPGPAPPASTSSRNVR